MKICSKCGITFADNDRFCNNCGNPLSETTVEEKKPVVEQLQSAPIPAGNSNPKATQVSQQFSYCPTCGQSVQASWQVCAYCGTRLKAAPQAQANPSYGYPMQGYAANPNQTPGVNPISIFALIIALILLITPFISTWRVTSSFLGLTDDVSFIDTVFISDEDRDTYDRIIKRESDGWGRDPEGQRNFFFFFGGATIFLFVFMIISYVVSLRAIAEKKYRKFWNLLRVCGWFGLLGNLLAMGCFLGYKSIYKDYLENNYSLHPNVWQFVAIILAVIVIVLCSAMKAKEKEEQKIAAKQANA